MPLANYSRKELQVAFYLDMSSKVNYAFKSYVLNHHSDLLKQVKRCRLYDNCLNRYLDDGITSKCLTNDLYYPGQMLAIDCANNGLIQEFKECIKILNADYKKQQTLQKRVKSFLLNGGCCFLTLTFNDDTLNKTTREQRRVFVVRYLKSCCAPYVANIDFGKNNGREHYHALINCESVDFTKWYKYGAIKSEKVRNRDISVDSLRLSKYVAKLSNHAIKNTTRRSALIYSR